MSDIGGKRPKVLGARVTGLRLTSDERLVLARIDGQHSVDDLVTITGFEAGRLEQIINKLAFDGALELADDRHVAVPGLDDGGTASLDDFAVALGLLPPRGDASVVEPRPSSPAAELKRPLSVRRHEPVATTPPIASSPVANEPPASDVRQTAAPVSDEANEEALGGRMVELETAESGTQALLLEGETAPVASDHATSDEADARADIEKDELHRASAERNYRQLFETRWHPLPTDARAHAARNAHGPDLLALCFDPDPRVVAAILENATTGLDHIRMIAFHHRTTTGLEMVARRQDWIRDLLVERRLLRNPMIGDIVLGRVMAPKRLFPTYKIAIDRDVPELTRVKGRGFIKQKWKTATSEERADLVTRTEGRCLIVMTGCAFDAKTTSILCGRPINSAMFVQMAAKFPASPPALLAHLLKQPFVRKNPTLKKMLLAHPNLPGDVKRSI